MLTQNEMKRYKFIIFAAFTSPHFVSFTLSLSMFVYISAFEFGFRLQYP